MLMLAAAPGCNLVPDLKHKPQYHNPFPQITKVAVLPFRNQSQEPTLSGSRVSMAYYNELQSIRGFEVIPCGVVENQLAYFETNVLRHPIMSPVDFQQFAKHLGVDAVLQGAVTDFDPYYPPRMTMKVNWYAANPGFHPIPVGYGLPWGTKAEKKIPEWIRLESERALAAEQLKTQSPVEPEEQSDEPEEAPQPTNDSVKDNPPPTSKRVASKPTKPIKSIKVTDSDVIVASHTEPAIEETQTEKPVTKPSRIAAARIVLPILPTDSADPSRVEQASVVQEPAKMPESVLSDSEPLPEPEPIAPIIVQQESVEGAEATQEMMGDSNGLPANWPDPQGFIPPRPKAQPPEMRVQYEPIISHMRTYNGNDEDFTHALEEYFYFRDDARFGGWQSYLQRSEDFIRFCCHQHVVETLASRGGQLESRMILRWPINRYER